MIWQILRFWVSFILPPFYKRLQIKNPHFARIKGPVIIAMNHPNSFVDPILFAVLTHPLRPSFLARGDAFKPGIASWFLGKIGIIPIFRIQDGGKEGLKKILTPTSLSMPAWPTMRKSSSSPKGFALWNAASVLSKKAYPVWSLVPMRV